MKEIKSILSGIYTPEEINFLEDGIKKLWIKYKNIHKPVDFNLTEKDVVLITYGDQVFRKGEAKLQTLNKLLLNKLKNEISIVHILPFFPSCSDDGFSVVDYYQVDPELGEWKDIEAISDNFKLLFDAVINHSSQNCEWFRKFLNNDEQYNEYYVEIDNPSEYVSVIRPRTSPLSHTYKSNNGTKEVWTTFSKEQVDLNFKNPKVLLQILDLLLFYISKGAQIIRLDAVGFLWKEKNTTCIHLPQTHSLIKVMRKVIEKLPSSTMLLSETNVPHLENISYFGNGNEAHMVYNFTLPPLLAYSILSGDTEKLSDWTQSLKLPYTNVCYFNFLASHDGIGVRPVDHILNKDELDILISSAKSNGGKISYKSNPDGKQSPYEINCNYFSLLKGDEGSEQLGIRRSIIAHAVLLVMPGLPAIYFHSMFGSENDIKGMQQSGINRRINRKKLECDHLNILLDNPNSRESIILENLKKMVRVRKTEPAFNPYALFKTNRSVKGIFSLERMSKDGNYKVKTFFNLTDKKVNIPLNYSKGKMDLLSGRSYQHNLELNPLEFVWLKIK